MTMIWRVLALVVVCVMAQCVSNEKQTGGDQNTCGLTGNWTNELGSKMEITCCSDGQLSGTYNSAVGHASDAYVLTGRYTETGSAVEVGWVVAYNNEAYGNSNSVASFSGIYYTEEDTIYTQWLLTSYVNRTDLWKGTLTNNNVFKRNCDE